MWHGLWVGMGLSWTDLRHEVSTGALRKSYTFSEVLIAICKVKIRIHITHIVLESLTLNAKV